MLGALEREPALAPAALALQVPAGDGSCGPCGCSEAAERRQRHRLADGSSSISADAAAPQPIIAAANSIAAPIDTGATAEASRGDTPDAPAGATGMLQAATGPPAEAAFLAEQLQPVASRPPRSATAEDAEAPSFMEDALGRRAELETAAALGSTEMSSSELVRVLAFTSAVPRFL